MHRKTEKSYAVIWLMICLLWAPLPAVCKGVVLILGDSLSAAHNMPVDKGWGHLLELRLKSELISPPDVVNASISGETSAGGLNRLFGLLLRYRPSIIIIELGGNDALRGLSLVQLRRNLDVMITISMASNAKVLLLGIDVPVNYGDAYRGQLRRIYTDLAQQHQVAVVPFFLEGVVQRADWMQSDGIHPTAAAQPKLLDNVWPELRSLLQSQG